MGQRVDMELEAALIRHFRLDFYPPLPSVLIVVAKAAIEEAHRREGANLERELELPEGCMFRGRQRITVAEAVSSMNLECFVANPSELSQSA
jgi:hypothetical protein